MEVNIVNAHQAYVFYPSTGRMISLYCGAGNVRQLVIEWMMPMNINREFTPETNAKACKGMTDETTVIVLEAA